MNVGIIQWADRKLGEIYDVTIMALFAKYQYFFENNMKISTNHVKSPPVKMGKLIYFNEKKQDLSHCDSMFNNNVINFVIVSIIVIAFINMTSISFSNADKPNVNYVNIQVDKGDTLWSIASRYASNKEDLRQFVYELKIINGLDNSAQIYSGQTLKVPISANFDRVVLQTQP